jgi:flavin reductase (DIM6/NTAB) family NADH-FMN oxidoreductase RutF
MPTPVWLIATYDSAGKPNIMTVAWGGICCSQPPAVTISLRQATYTFAALDSRKAFTVNIPSQSQAAQADYAGIVSGRDADKLAACHWTAVRSELVDAPYVSEVPLVLECRVIHRLEVGLHTMFVGQILDVKADPAVLGAKRYPDITKVQPILWDPAQRRYLGTGAVLGQAWEIGKAVGEVSPEGTA